MQPAGRGFESRQYPNQKNETRDSVEISHPRNENEAGGMRFAPKSGDPRGPRRGSGSAKFFSWGGSFFFTNASQPALTLGCQCNETIRGARNRACVFWITGQLFGLRIEACVVEWANLEAKVHAPQLAREQWDVN